MTLYWVTWKLYYVALASILVLLLCSALFGACTLVIPNWNIIPIRILIDKEGFCIVTSCLAMVTNESYSHLF